MENPVYFSGMSRRSTRQRPRQGAHLAQLRQGAGLTQAELASALGVPQQTVAFWEYATKPPRSDLLPKLAQALGVTVESLLRPGAPVAQRRGPKGKLLQAFEEAAALPKRQQQLVQQFVATLVAQHRIRAA